MLYCSPMLLTRVLAKTAEDGECVSDVGSCTSHEINELANNFAVWNFFIASISSGFKGQSSLDSLQSSMGV